MKRIVFVCHGNICRSPMAEFVMKDLVKKAGKENAYGIRSAAVSSEEEGNGVYPPARRELERRGIPWDSAKRAVRLTCADYARADLFLVMDESNLVRCKRIFGGDPDGKVKKLLSYTDRIDTDVADPWYTGNFAVAYDDILEGCTALFSFFENGSFT